MNTDNLSYTRGIVNVSAKAQREVKRDVINIMFSTTVVMPVRKPGEDEAFQADQVAARDQLLTAYTTAMNVIKPKASSKVKAALQGFSVRQEANYNDEGDEVGKHWTGSVSIMVSGTDHKTIMAFPTIVDSMSVQYINYSVSQKLRDETKRKITDDAIANFNKLAAQYTLGLKYNVYHIHEVSIDTNFSTGRSGFSGDAIACSAPTPTPVGGSMRKLSAFGGATGPTGATGATGPNGPSGGSSAPMMLEVEPGTEIVTVSVNGSIVISQ